MATNKPTVQGYVNQDTKNILKNEVNRREKSGQKASESQIVGEVLEDYFYAIDVRGFVSAGSGIEVRAPELAMRVKLDKRPPQAGCYALLVTGDSMDGGTFPISSGDVLLFCPISDYKNALGKSVHVEWHDGFSKMNTLKKLTEWDEEGIELSPMNPDHDAIRFTKQEAEESEVEIVGMFIRKLA